MDAERSIPVVCELIELVSKIECQFGRVEPRKANLPKSLAITPSAFRRRIEELCVAHMEHLIVHIIWHLIEDAIVNLLQFTPEGVSWVSNNCPSTNLDQHWGSITIGHKS